MRPIDANVAINTIQKDRETSWKELENDDVEYKNGCDDGYAYSMQIVSELPTLDVIPRQKYEDDMESAFAHGYTDAESNFRKMIADGELVEVVRCENCKHYKKSEVSDRMMCWRKDVDGQPVCYDFNPNDFCSYGKRRTDEND